MPPEEAQTIGEGEDSRDTVLSPELAPMDDLQERAERLFPNQGNFVVDTLMPLFNSNGDSDALLEAFLAADNHIQLISDLVERGIEPSKDQLKLIQSFALDNKRRKRAERRAELAAQSSGPESREEGVQGVREQATGALSGAESNVEVLRPRPTYVMAFKYAGGQWQGVVQRVDRSEVDQAKRALKNDSFVATATMVVDRDGIRWNVEIDDTFVTSRRAELEQMLADTDALTQFFHQNRPDMSFS
ncbi:hypothetical protein KJ742_07335 [Patescibacteria group bacterium]|nr:hypothetical protein [Patescibacteria group bacterium]MBU1683723.1 hypothetical protein [Patescibacteria group bacterium]MBU1935528.1 hypothetical protein [Patescibacteria group bacterium]